VTPERDVRRQAATGRHDAVGTPVVEELDVVELRGPTEVALGDELLLGGVRVV
jgi:hypothetical protein